MFLYPSKPVSIHSPVHIVQTLERTGLASSYRVQVKKNGCRAITSTVGGNVIIQNRERGIALSVSHEHDWSLLKQIFPESLLDGECIGRKQAETSNKMYLWDLPFWNGISLISEKYSYRYSYLLAAFYSFAREHQLKVYEDICQFWIEHSGVIVGITKAYPIDEWQKLVKQLNKGNVRTGENEGLVFKNIEHHLNWSGTRTIDINEQMKFLFKYSFQS